MAPLPLAPLLLASASASAFVFVSVFGPMFPLVPAPFVFSVSFCVSVSVFLLFWLPLCYTLLVLFPCFLLVPVSVCASLSFFVSGFLCSSLLACLLDCFLPVRLSVLLFLSFLLSTSFKALENRFA